MNINDAVRTYPVTWLVGEPLVAAEAARNALQNILTENSLIKMWTPVYGTQLTTVPVGTSQPKILEGRDAVKDLLNSVTSEKFLVVMADSLEAGAQLNYALMTVIRDDRRVIFISSRSAPDNLAPDYLEEVSLQYETLETDVQELMRVNERTFNANVLPVLKGLRPFRVGSSVLESIAETDDTEELPYLQNSRARSIERDSGGSLRILDTSKIDLEGLIGLERGKRVYSAMAEAVMEGKPVRGGLSVGIQGCGKTQLVKWLAKKYGMILYELDMSANFGKYVGDTERSVRRTLEVLRSVPSGAVLMDEIEKQAAGVGSRTDGDSGTSKRAGMGYLKYLENPVSGSGYHLIQATSNDVMGLPPEYTRAGRWDVLLWFGFPQKDQAASILSYYRNQFKLPASFKPKKMDELYEMTPAEMESVCRIADILHSRSWEESVAFVPRLKKFRFEEMEQMEQWAKGRAVDANDDAPEVTAVKAAVTRTVHVVHKKK